MSNEIKQKVILCILDGWGLAPPSPKNAISLAKKKNFDLIINKYSNTQLNASENDVGLPVGQFGNSEVGHMNIGAGRVILQNILRISYAIKSGELKKNEKVKLLKKNCRRIHIVGLLSSGGVHGHQDHLFSLIDILSDNDNELFIHCILDGRDSSPNSGIDNMKLLLEKIKKKKVTIASICGRYYAMDRDNRWDRIKQAYKAIIEGSIKNKIRDPIKAIEQSYKKSVTDEFFLPINNYNYKGIEDGDGFLITNYRADRVREILTSIFDKDFDSFERQKIQNFKNSLGIMEYSRKLKKSLNTIFEPQKIKNTLGSVISELNLKQLRIAETEKYAHVTYFFNGGIEENFLGEDRILIPSPRVNTYDQKPEMSAKKLTSEILKQIKSQKYDLIITNYANADMVGHTGVIPATVKAIETVDDCIGKLLKTAKKENYLLILTSDHGNADCMKDTKKNPLTSHTTNPVPMIICSSKKTNLQKGCLADIAPTILNIMGIKKPTEMSGRSLIK
ncbi:MAG: phosphoglycerate mutase (2,3-diphosphoglycerate-independent) [Rickettsiales bacterium]|nr:phosphoglycerate mutase (2,3-diphosphoglycerate-independent) [Rickettsiales bacterium]